MVTIPRDIGTLGSGRENLSDPGGVEYQKKWKPRELIPTIRFFEDGQKDILTNYRNVMKLVKKYGCPISKVSDGKDWIRVYFEIPADKINEFIEEEKQFRQI